MAKTIDQRVVEMQFDNRNFEKNVATSMSTLDKLKEKLSFKGAERAMDELNGSLKSVNTSFLEKAIDGVGGKFSALEQIAIGALRNIGQQAVATGEQIIKSLTTDNIAAGWEKYGKETNAVATLRAQGYDLELIEEQLAQLNFFTDETSYNFTDMVAEIGKFTAAGQGLEDSLIAMQGIASWAALSGQNAQTASRAMYQLSQAMGSGIMRKEDYKSIQNASMDTKEFRQRVLDTAVALGTLKKNADGTYKSLVEDVKDGDFTIEQFADHLTKDMWFTSDVMMAVYKDYGKAAIGLKAYMDKTGIDTASAAMDELETKAKATAEEMVRLGKATDVSAAMDQALQMVSLQEMMSDETVYAKATAFMEEYNSSLEDGQTRIERVEDALVEMGYVIDEFSLKAFRAGQEARTWTDVLDSVKDAVSSKWSGTFKAIFGDQEEAVTLWTRFANDFYDIFASSGDNRNDVLGIWREWIEPKTRDMLEAAKGIPSAIRDTLKAEATVNGRDLLFSTDENNLGAIIQLLQTLKDLLGIISDAWNEIFFGTTDADEVAQQKADILMAITKAIKALADYLVIDDDRADKLRRTFKGLFAILDIIVSFIEAAFYAAWTALSALFGNVNIDVLDLSASLGDNLVAFRDWLKENDAFTNFFKTIGNGIATFIGWIKSLIDYIASIPWVADVLDKIRAGFETAVQYISEFFDRLGKGETAGDIFSNIVDKLYETSDVVKFLVDGFEKVKTFLSDLFKNIGDFFSKAFSGTLDPSEMFSGIQQGFTDVQNGATNFWDAISGVFKNIGDGIATFVENVKGYLGELNGEKIARIIGAGVILLLIFKLATAIETLMNWFKAFAEVGTTVVSAIKGISDSFQKAVKKISTAISDNIRAKAFIAIAKAILMLVGALVALYFMDSKKLGESLLILSGLATVLLVLGTISGKMNGLLKGAIGIAAISASLMLLVAALAMLGNIKNLGQSAGALAILSLIAGFLSSVAVVLALLMKNGANMGFEKELRSTAGIILSISGSIILLGVAAKILSTIDREALIGAVAAIAVFSLLIAGLIIVINKFPATKIAGIGAMMLGIAAAFIIVAGAIKVFSLLDQKTFEDGITRVGLVGVIFALLVAVSAIAGEHGSKAGSMILKMSIAFLAMVAVVKLASLITDDEMSKGLGLIIKFGLICAALIAVSKLAGQYAAKAGAMLLEMSVAMAVLTAIIWALSYIPAEGLQNAAIVVGGLMLVFGALVAVTKLASDVKGTIIALTVAVAVLAGAISALAIIDDDTGKIYKAAAAMAIVMVVFAAVIAATKVAQKMLGTLIVLTVAIGAIGAALYFLATTGNNAENAIKAAEAMAIVMAAMAGVILAFSLIKQSSIKGMYAGAGAMLVLALVMSILQDVIVGMKDIDGNTAIANAGALAILLGAMGLIVAAFGLLGISWSKFGGVALGVAAIAAIAYLVLPAVSDAISGMQQVDANSALQYVYAISTLLLAMAGIIVILGVLGAVAGGIAGSGVGIGVGIGIGIGAAVNMFLGIEALKTISSEVLPHLKDALNGMRSLGGQESLQYAISLSALLLAMAGCLAVLAFVGGLAFSAVVGIAALTYLSTEVMPTLRDIIVGMQTLGGEQAIQYALAMSEFLIAMSADLVILSIVGTFATSALIGIVVLSVIAEALMSLASKIGELVQTTPQIQEFVDTGIPVLEQLGTALGTFFGNIVGGFIDAVASGIFDIFPIMATKLSDFSENIKPFIKNMSGIKEEDMKGVSALVNAITALTAAELINKLSEFVGFATGNQNPMDSFAKGLKGIGTGIADFSTAVNGKIDVQSNDDAIKSLGDLVGLEGSMGVFDLIGAFALGQFATNLKGIGEGIADFSTAVNGKIYPQSNEYAISALTKLVGIEQGMDIINKIANFGLGMFSSNLGIIASGIAEFSSTVNGKMYKADVEVALDAVERLAAVEGSFEGLEKLFGSTGLNMFSTNLPAIGKAIGDFSVNVTGRMNQRDNDEALKALERLAAVESSFDIITKVTGLTGLDDFASNFKLIGAAIADFSKEVNGKIYPQSNEYAMTTLRSLVDMGKSITGGNIFGFMQSMNDSTAITLFAANFPILGRGLSQFATSVGGNLSTNIVYDSAKNAVNILSALTDVQKNMSGGSDPYTFIDKISGITNMSLFAANLPLLGTGIAAFAQALKEAGYIGSDDGKNATDALTALSNMNSLLEQVADSSKVEGYSKTLTEYAEALSGFGDVLGDIYTAADKFDPEKLTNVTACIEEINAIKEKLAISDTYTKTATTGSGFDWMGSLGMDTSSILGGIKGIDTTEIQNTLSTTLGNIDISSTGTDLLGQFTGGFSVDNLIGGENGFDISGIQETLTNAFGGIDISSAGTDLLSQFTGGFSVDNLIGGENGFDISGIQETLTNAFGSIDISSAGTDLLGQFTGAFTNEESTTDITETGKSVAKTFKDGFESQNETLKTSGRNAVIGLTNAIKGMAPQALEAGEEIAKSLTSGIEIQLKIASPSKETYRLGEYAATGFINAVIDSATSAFGAGDDLGVSVTDGLKQALEQSADLFDTTVDVEPTIRPVLDLSNISEGVSQLDGMLNGTNFDQSYSYAMAQRAQYEMTEMALNMNARMLDNESMIEAMGDNNQELITELRAQNTMLQSRLEDLTDRMSKLQVVLDTNAVVGELVAPMDNALGTRAVRGSRR